jgi:hypothetical protein
MDNNLYKKVENIIRNDTGLGVVRLSVIDIHDKLKAAGLKVSEPEIAEILEALVKEKHIEIERQVSPKDTKKHGTYVITWVSARL